MQTPKQARARAHTHTHSLSLSLSLRHTSSDLASPASGCQLQFLRAAKNNRGGPGGFLEASDWPRGAGLEMTKEEDFVVVWALPCAAGKAPPAAAGAGRVPNKGSSSPNSCHHVHEKLPEIKPKLTRPPTRTHAHTHSLTHTHTHTHTHTPVCLWYRASSPWPLVRAAL